MARAENIVVGFFLSLALLCCSEACAQSGAGAVIYYDATAGRMARSDAQISSHGVITAYQIEVTSGPLVADLATTASYATTATTALSAGTATTATNAVGAMLKADYDSNNDLYVDQATHALTADTATTANVALFTTYQTDYTTHALTADYATSAGMVPYGAGLSMSGGVLVNTGLLSDTTFGGDITGTYDDLTLTMTNALHGNLGGGSLHALATQSTAGFMSATDKTKLDNLTGTGSLIGYGKVSDGSTIATAASAADTLRIRASSTVTPIVRDNDPTYGDYLQLNVSMGLGDLSNVYISGTPGDTQALVYNALMGRWQPGSPVGNSVLTNLYDVSAASPSDGDVLTWDSGTSRWVNQAPTGGSSTLAALTDTNLGTPSDGDVLSYDSGTSKWVSSAPSGGSSTLSGLSDTNIVSPSDGQFVTYDNGTSKWVNSTLSLDANDLSDINITSVENGQYLVYNSVAGEWRNQTLSATVDGGPMTINAVNTLDVHVLMNNGSNGQGRIYEDSLGGGWWTSNAYWNGSAWVRDTSSKASYAIGMHGTNNRYEFRIFNSGSASISWLTPFFINVNGSVTLDPRASAPSSPTEGSVYYSSSDHKLKCWNGSTWNNLF